MNRFPVIALFFFSITLSLFLAGCFPSTVSVGPDGRVALPREEGIFLLDIKAWKAFKLYEAEKGKEPTWVQWSPKGDKLLYVANNTLFVAAPDGKNVKTLYKATSNMGYCLWSPDGKSISVTELQGLTIENPDSDDKKIDETGLKNESMPRLKILDAETGKEKWSVNQISFIHRWLPDSKSLAVFHASKKDKDTGIFSGEIALVDAEKGNLTTCALAQSLESWLDVTPDGKDIYFTSQSAALDKESLKSAVKESKNKLYRIVLGKKPLEELSPASMVSVSPDGKKLLFFRQQEEGTEFVVADREGDKEKVIARNISLTSSEMAGGKILPVWLNNEEIMYWRYVTVLAPDGKALFASIAKIDGTKTTRIQSYIEDALSKAERAK
jgi:Tol biopolymer transport system component